MLLLFFLFLITPIHAAPIGTDFTLTDHHGNPYHLADQRGKVVVMFFGFTHCPSICPDSLVKMTKVLKSLEDRADQVSVVFITVDPERDSVEKLAQYVPFFSKQLLGLTGSKTQIAAVTKAYRVSSKLIKKTPQDKLYTVDHSADIYVLDRSGKVDTIVPYGMPASHVLRVVEGVLSKPFSVKSETKSEQPKSLLPQNKQLALDSGAANYQLALPDLEGKLYHLTDYLGKTLVINFWATWCPPCRAELPAFNRAWAALKDEDVVMLAVNVGEEKAAVNAFLQDFPIDFPVLLDVKGASMQRWKIKGMPTTVVLNPAGQLIYHVTGERKWDDPEVLAQIRALKQGIKQREAN